MVSGTLENTENVKAGTAAPLNGNAGGGPQLEIPDATAQVQVDTDVPIDVPPPIIIEP
jgi:hypothetical protein